MEEHQLSIARHVKVRSRRHNDHGAYIPVNDNRVSIKRFCLNDNVSAAVQRHQNGEGVFLKVQNALLIHHHLGIPIVIHPTIVEEWQEMISVHGEYLNLLVSPDKARLKKNG